MGRYYTAQESRDKFNNKRKESMYANTVLLARITQEIELKYTPSGMAVANLSVVVNEKFKDKQGNMQEKASFFNCVAWGKTAENINTYFNKGEMIFLACTPKQESWDDKDGNKRSAIKFNIDRFSFVGGKKDDSQGAVQNKPTTQQPVYNATPDTSFASDSIPF